MKAVFQTVWLQWKLDFRNRGAILTYYAIPLIFFLLMGAGFSTINPEFSKTLVQSMTAFSVSMGALLGTPMLLSELCTAPIKKAYRVGGIPLWAVAAGEFLSGFVHLSIMAAVIFFAAPPLFHAERPQNLPLYVGTLALFVTVSLVIGLLLGLLLRGPKLTMISQLIFMPSLLLSGMMFPVTMLPKAVADAGQILPASQMLLLTASSSENFWPLAGILAAALLLVALRLWRMERE